MSGARIVYGVSGEGSGHSSRARETATRLLADGHEVLVVTYDRGVRNLADDFDVVETEGLHIATVDNRVSVARTFAENLARLPDGWRGLNEVRRRCFRAFRPDVVLTDFEPQTAYLAQHHGVPLVSLDNQHRMRYMEHPIEPRLERDAKLTRTIIRLLVPRPDVSLVTTFYFGRVKNERTFLFPPILRGEVREAEPEDAGHVLVYFTQGYDSFLDLVRAEAAETGRRFVVYGYDREEDDGALAFRRPSRAGFLEDLRTATAVVSTAGFTLLTESLQLGKPFLALPMAGQYEQELNALMLAELGYGANGRAGGMEPTRATLTDFLADLPRFRERLATYDGGDPEALPRFLAELLADDCARARAFHAARR